MHIIIPLLVIQRMPSWMSIYHVSLPLFTTSKNRRILYSPAFISTPVADLVSISNYSFDSDGLIVADSRAVGRSPWYADSEDGWRYQIRSRAMHLRRGFPYLPSEQLKVAELCSRRYCRIIETLFTLDVSASFSKRLEHRRNRRGNFFRDLLHSFAKVYSSRKIIKFAITRGTLYSFVELLLSNGKNRFTKSLNRRLPKVDKNIWKGRFWMIAVAWKE